MDFALSAWAAFNSFSLSRTEQNAADRGILLPSASGALRRKLPRGRGRARKAALCAALRQAASPPVRVQASPERAARPRPADYGGVRRSGRSPAQTRESGFARGCAALFPRDAVVADGKHKDIGVLRSPAASVAVMLCGRAHEYVRDNIGKVARIGGDRVAVDRRAVL